MSAAPLPPELALAEEPLSVDAVDNALAELACAPTGYAPALAAVEARPDVAPVVRWQIDGDGSADWCMRHVAIVDAELRQLQEQAEDWSERIAEWFEHRATPLQRRRAFFVGHLERYALDRRESDPKAKTLVLPSGKVSTLAGKRKVVVTDPEAFRVWAADHHQRHPDDPIVRAKYELDAAEAKERAVYRPADDGEDAPAVVVDTDTGELLPWAEVVDGPTTAKVVPG